jgi:hypothetical protein
MLMYSEDYSATNYICSKKIGDPCVLQSKQIVKAYMY